MNVYIILLIAAIGLIGLILFLIFGTKKNPPDEQAKGFAKLLVTEIKLYNDYKIQRGLANNNLYASLRDEIEEARRMCQKRFGSSEHAGYFDNALINVLAVGDKNKLGSEFNPMRK